MKKIKNQKGFTLLEMLACVVTMLLLTAICAMGTQMAIDSYNRSLYVSDSQMLESTINVYMADFFRYATINTQEQEENPGQIEDQGKLIVTNMSYGVYHGWIELKDGRFFIFKNMEDEDGAMLLSENVYTKGLKITNFIVKYNDTTNCVEGSYMIESTIIEDAKKECTFAYRLVTEY